MKTYTQYVTHYQPIVQMLKTRKDALFTNYLNGLVTSECKGKGLKDYLIMPVQRIPRYNMMLAVYFFLHSSLSSPSPPFTPLTPFPPPSFSLSSLLLTPFPFPSLTPLHLPPCVFLLCLLSLLPFPPSPSFHFTSLPCFHSRSSPCSFPSLLLPFLSPSLPVHFPSSFASRLLSPSLKD